VSLNINENYHRVLEQLAEYEVFISPVVFSEIERANEQKRELLTALIQKFRPGILSGGDDVATLAGDYIEALALPKSSFEDALHAAFDTVMEIDILLSWNMNDLANVNRKHKINAVNLQNGYTKVLEIVTPAGLRSYED